MPTIELGSPYHDPASPLYTRSLNPAHQTIALSFYVSSLNQDTANAAEMTHTPQLSPSSSDYFSHKPRSFLSHHTDYDEKPPNSPTKPYTPSRGRHPSRAIAYAQPSPSLSSSTVGGVGRLRAPLRGTMLRLLLLCAVLGLAVLGWRCESVGCRGRGGGGLVGGYVGGGSVVAGWGGPGMPEVVKGWGTSEGVDLSAYWGAAAPAFSGLSEGDGDGEDGEGEGELVGFQGVDMQTGEVHWDDEEAVFGIGEVSGGPGEGAEPPSQQLEELAQPDEAVRDENTDGDDEAAEGGSALGAATGGEGAAEFLSAQVNAVQPEIAPGALLAQKKSWLGSLVGLF